MVTHLEGEKMTTEEIPLSAKHHDYWRDMHFKFAKEADVNPCCPSCGELFSEELSPNIEAFEISGSILCDECAEKIFEDNSQFGVGA
jgi:formylmethanofuran dehydrogenase subunit E